MNWVGVRNFLIIAGLAGLVFVSRRGFDSAAVSANVIITIIFVAAILLFGYRYFRENRLAWLVLRPWQRIAIIVCSVGIVFLLVAGFPLLGPRVSDLGVIALVAALALVIVWVIKESRRFR